MYVFGTIDNTSTNIESNEVNYSQNLNTSSLGIQTIKIVSGSINTNYWNSLNTLFYTSGSPKYIGENRFQNSAVNLSITQKVGEQFLSKYHGYPSSSLITIPNQYFGERIREGFKIAIIGPANAGKSSLLNYLSKREVAIVSEIAGTTRAVIEAHLNLDGYPVILADTAGIREAKNEVEKKGISLALGKSKEVDLNNTDGSGVNPIIRDDGFGNLYATNANPNFGTLTASSAGANNSISSSLNYV